MWYQSLVQSPRKSGTDPDSHAHSPRRRDGSRDAVGTVTAMLPPPAIKMPGVHDPHWSSLPPLADPFIEDARLQYPSQWAATRPSTVTADHSMPDYSHPSTPASSRHYSNHNESSHWPAENTDSQFEELIAGWSPQKEVMGIHAPANTRVSSTTGTPPKLPKVSRAAEARAASYPHANARSVSVTTRDPQQPPPPSRHSSDVSMKSAFSAQTSEQAVKTKPTTEIKSRKEGRSSETNVPFKAQPKKYSARPCKVEQDGEEKPVMANESKRKRSIALPAPEMHIENLLSSSPTRKASKIEGREGRKGIDLMDEESAWRNPLGEMGNRV